MSEFDDFFSQVNSGDENNEGLAKLPATALTNPLEAIMPFEIVYPKAIQYAGAFALDNATKSLALNVKARLSYEEINPDSLNMRLPTMRVASLLDGELVDGFIVDIRNTSLLANIDIVDVDDANARHSTLDSYKDRLYVPALAVVFETEEGFPAYNGDPRFIKFGKQLLISANEKSRELANRFADPPSGSYAIFDTNYTLEPVSTLAKDHIEDPKSVSEAGSQKKWWKRNR